MTSDTAAVPAWVSASVAGLGPTPSRAQIRHTRSGATLWLLPDLVVKLHAARTDPAALAVRLRVAAGNSAFVSPCTTSPLPGPDGRVASVWPRVPVLDPTTTTEPWVMAGDLLAGLHRSPPPAAAPRHGWPDRLRRARDRAPERLQPLGDRLLAEVAARAEAPVLLHGDWHLGQLGFWNDRWRLLDMDDVGVGDPAWDLARPAGFWACGLLSDADWDALCDGYRASGGPGLPRSEDPWPGLDLPARCAVFVAAVAAVREPTAHSRETAAALLAACRAMAQ